MNKSASNSATKPHLLFPPLLGRGICIMRGFGIISANLTINDLIRSGGESQEARELFMHWGSSGCYDREVTHFT